MLLTPHILTGVAIATKVPNPIWALILVFLSHYFWDCFPQTEYNIKSMKEKRWNKSFPDFLKVFLDISFGALMIFLFSEFNYLILAAACLAILPDGFTFLYFIFSQNKFLQKHYRFHQKINGFLQDKKISPFWGILSQVAVMATAIFFLLQ